MSRISGAKWGADSSICAMKEGLRLAQSLHPQPIEQMGFFAHLSRLPRADSTLSEKRDSAGDSALLSGRFLPLPQPANGRSPKTC
jgi:hypothetical protein